MQCMQSLCKKTSSAKKQKKTDSSNEKTEKNRALKKQKNRPGQPAATDPLKTENVEKWG